MPTWTTPATFSTGQLVAASDLNTYVRDNTSYLLNRPLGAIKRDNNADYTTTSTTFVDIDGTNLAITLTPSGSAILMGFTGMSYWVTAFGPMFDFTIDGVRYASAGQDGLGQGVLASGTQYACPITLTALATGLTPGVAHTVKIQWKTRSGGTGEVFSGDNTAGQDWIPTLWAVEVG